MNRYILSILFLLSGGLLQAQTMDTGATAVQVSIGAQTIPDGGSNVALSVAALNGLCSNGGSGGVGCNVIPGKVYTIAISIPESNAYSAASLTVSAPTGYVINVNGLPTSTILFQVPEPEADYNGTTYYNLLANFIVIPAQDMKPLAAGACTTPLPGAVYWEVGLGVLPNGQAAGRIGLISDGSGDWSQLANVSSLFLITPNFNTGAGIPEFQQTQCIVETAQVSPTSFTISFYNWSQITTDLGLNNPAGGINAPRYTFAGKTPYMVYTVTYTGTPGDPNHLQLTSTATSEAGSRTMVCTIGETGGTYTELGWNGGTWTTTGWYDPSQSTVPLATTTAAVTVSGQTVTEDILLKDASGNTADHTKKTFFNYGWGLELTEEDHIPNSGSAVTTSYGYYSTVDYSTGTADTNYGHLASVTYPNGTTESWTYNWQGLTATDTKAWCNTAGGSVTTYSYAVDGTGLPIERAAGATTAVGGVTSSCWTATPSGVTANPGVTTPTWWNVQPLETSARSDYPSASSTALVTTTNTYREDSTSWFHWGMPASQKRPDGTKDSYGYEAGTWNGTTFTPTKDPGEVQWIVLNPNPVSPLSSIHAVAVRTSIIHGCSASVTGSSEVTAVDGGEAIDPVYVVGGKSTKEVTIRDSQANIVRTELWVWNSPSGGTGGSWALLSYSTFAYDPANQLVSRTDSTGATYQASWKGDFKVSETDSAGIVTTYSPDAAWRVGTEQRTAAGLGTLTTKYAYDADNRMITKVVGNSGGENLTSSWVYDTAGRLSSETDQNGVTTGYVYLSGGGLQTNYANGGTKIETYYLDGRRASVTGSAVVPTYYSYEIKSDNSLHTTVNSGTSNSARLQETWTDMMGRTIKTSRPGFNGQPAYLEISNYDPNTGQLTSKSRQDGNGNQLAAITLYGYDALGQLNQTGLHVDSTSGLNVGGNDRITDSDVTYGQFSYAGNSNWWKITTKTTYPTAGSSASLVTSTDYQRMTGFVQGGSVQAEEVVVDVNQNSTDIQTVVNTGNNTVTQNATTIGTSNTKAVVTVGGLTTSATGFDGLTTTTAYDSLWRAHQQTDSRGNTTTTNYYTSTSLPWTIVDAKTITIETYTYDTAGRVSTSTDAGAHVTRFAYDTMNHVTNQWGDAVNPVSYGYDVYGMRTTMSTYCGGTGWNGTNWPSSTGTANVTTWNYDPASGLLASKVDNAQNQVSFTYNSMGQTQTRKLARGVLATYGYDPNTSELLSITYSDGTPAVGYTYNRSGTMNTVTDASSSGDHTGFNYNPKQLLQLQSIQFGAFFNNRFLTEQYNTDNLLPGRPSGFLLGPTSGSSADLSQTYGFDNGLRLNQINSTTGGNNTLPSFSYTYDPNSDLITKVTAGTASTGYQVNYTYEAQRNLVTMVQSGWVGASGPLTEFDYAYDPQRRRQSAQQSGLAFNDYYSPGTGYGAVSTYYQYDSLSEVQTAATYRGAAVATGSPASTDELPGRRFEYRYDNSGNRTVSGPADPSGPASSIDDTYTLNSLGLNQYIDRQNNTVRVLGNAAAGSTVTVPGASVGQLDRNYGATLVPANQSGPAQGTITVSAVVQVSGINYSQSLSPRNYTVPAQTQQFAYDADGNLTSDGMWTYIYDGENRLIETTSSLPASQGFTRLDLKFKYDYLNRRIEKQVFNIDVNPTQATLDHKYIYDGWNLIAETDASGNLLRSYTWGLDVTGSLTSSGGVGALLAITNVSGGTATNYFTAYDGNGNLAALVNSAGGATTPDLAAVYEFAPFGEPLRAEVFDTNIQDNAFRFSSKYTDSETGLAYYGKRYYSPSLGRFINRDPAEEAGGLNLYGFCGNNAINRFDVLGNMTSGDMFLRAAWENLLDYVQYDLGSDTTNSYGSDADRDSRMDRPSEESLQEQAEQKGVVAQQAQANTADQKEDVNVFKAVFELGKNLVKTVEAALGNSKGGGGPNGQTSGPNSEISPNENAKNALPDNAFTEYSSKILKSDTQFAKLAGRLAGNDWAGWKALWELGKMPRDDGGLFTGKYYEDALLGYIDPNSNGVITTRRGSEGQLLHADVPLTQYGRDGGMHMDLSISPKNLVFWAHTHDDDLAPTYPNDASSNYKGINAWSIVISKQRLFFLSPDFKYDMDKEKTTSGSAYFMYLEKLRNGGYSDGK